jgi:hypothetical protein
MITVEPMPIISQKHEYGNQIAGGGDADGTAGVGERPGQFDDCRLVDGEQSAGERHQGKNRREQPAGPIAFDDFQLVVEEADGERYGS